MEIPALPPFLPPIPDRKGAAPPANGAEWAVAVGRKGLIVVTRAQQWRRLGVWHLSCGDSLARTLTVTVGVELELRRSFASKLGVGEGALEAELAAEYGMAVRISRTTTTSHTITSAATKCHCQTVAAWQLHDIYTIEIHGLFGTLRFRFPVPGTRFANDKKLFADPECCVDPGRRRRAPDSPMFVLAFPGGAEVVQPGTALPDGLAAISGVSGDVLIGGPVPIEVVGPTLRKLADVAPHDEAGRRFATVRQVGVDPVEPTPMPDALALLNTATESELKKLAGPGTAATVRKVVAGRGAEGYTNLDEIAAAAGLSEDAADLVIVPALTGGYLRPADHESAAKPDRAPLLPGGPDGVLDRTGGVDMAAERAATLYRCAAAPSSPNLVSATRIGAETGVTVDVNPYFGIDKPELEAAIRASAYGSQPPHVLLALWAREGSTRRVTWPRSVPSASTVFRARALFTAIVFYEDLGLDHFVVTSYDHEVGDNVISRSDGDALAHAARLRHVVGALHADGMLPADVSTAMYRSLRVRRWKDSFLVVPTTRFYAYALMLAGAFFTTLQQVSFDQLPDLSPAMNYLHWNLGTGRFRDFLEFADDRRTDPEHGPEPPSIEEWALHRVPEEGEWRQRRVNAIRFMHGLQSYEPIFAG